MSASKLGRPSSYTPDLGARICELISDGSSLKAAAAKVGIAQRTAYLWLNDHPDFLQLYARAREDQADTLADDLLDIADDPKIPSDDKRIRVDARKWIASKLKPRKYGDRQQIEHSGSIASTTDPNAIAEQLVTMANANPTMIPFIRAWAEKLIARLPEIPT